MDALTFVPILIIACIGFGATMLGVVAESKAARRKLLREERQEIINAIINYKRLSSNPDVRDTKNAIIDAITRRDSL